MQPGSNLLPEISLLKVIPASRHAECSPVSAYSFSQEPSLYQTYSSLCLGHRWRHDSVHIYCINVDRQAGGQLGGMENREMC